MAFKLSDLPPAMQKQILAKFPPKGGQVEPIEPTTHPTAKGPTKTEMAYRSRYLGDNTRFQGVTFRMANGHRYTPDWVTMDGDRMTCIEVKGSYRLGSYQRARLAFDQARIEWPGVTWIWAELSESGEWTVTKHNEGI